LYADRLMSTLSWDSLAIQDSAHSGGDMVENCDSMFIAEGILVIFSGRVRFYRTL
jgi:hypothetical protein